MTFTGNLAKMESCRALMSSKDVIGGGRRATDEVEDDIEQDEGT